MAMLLPGPVALMGYNLATNDNPALALALVLERKDISTLVAGFCFTMLGFLAAVITILFAFVHSETFKSYERVGYLDLLFFIYIFTIVNLMITALLSLYGFSSTTFVWPFRIMLMSFVNNLIQVGVITLSVANLARRAAGTL